MDIARKNLSAFEIKTYSGADKVTPDAAADIDAYYALRRRVYVQQWGSEQDAFYGNYPTEHDARPETVFMIFKVTDPDTGKSVVAGGRRLVLPVEQKVGTLPFEGKHEIGGSNPFTRTRKLAEIRKRSEKPNHNGYKTLLNKPAIDVLDVVPALSVGTDVRTAELGAFVIDRAVTDKLLTQPEYKAMRETAYKDSLTAVKNAHADIAIIDAGFDNLLNQEKWLKTQARDDGTKLEFKRLGVNWPLLGNPFESDVEGPARRGELSDQPHSELLLVNVSDRFKLGGAESILRYNQTAAQAARGGR